MTSRRLTLLDVRRGLDTQHLEASWDDEKGLVVEGHDIGPATAVMNDRGDYEWRYVIAIDRIPELLDRLGADPDADIIEVLAGWTGPRAYEFEGLTRDLRTGFWSW